MTDNFTKLVKELYENIENPTGDTSQQTISFDFDNTIGLMVWNQEENDYERDDNGDEIQLPNKQIIQRIHNYKAEGYNVIVVTSRYEQWKQDVADKLKEWDVPITEIHCTNHNYKVGTLKRLGVIKHFDDDVDELRRIKHTRIIPVRVRNPYDPV